jgi:hypothetical protein
MVAPAAGVFCPMHELSRPERRRRRKSRGHWDQPEASGIQVRTPDMRKAGAQRKRCPAGNREPVSGRAEVRQVHARGFHDFPDRSPGPDLVVGLGLFFHVSPSLDRGQARHLPGDGGGAVCFRTPTGVRLVKVRWAPCGPVVIDARWDDLIDPVERGVIEGQFSTGEDPL